MEVDVIVLVHFDVQDAAVFGVLGQSGAAVDWLRSFVCTTID
jgi:hypothetical protein